MGKEWVKPILISTLFYFTIAGFSHAVQAQSALLPFRLVNNTMVIVSLTANGEGPLDFVLDTGTDTTLVDPLLAARFSLPAAGEIRLNSLAGSQIVASSVLQKLTLGPAQVRDLHVLIQDLSAERKIDPLITGVVGQNFLSHFNYLLDYQAHSILVELSTEIRTAVEGDSVLMHTTGNRMVVVATVQSSDQARLRLTLDSGASAVMLVGRRSQVIGLRENKVGMGTDAGFHALVGRVNLLTVGSAQFHDLRVLLCREPAYWEQIEDGVLPTALFRALYVNNKEGFVIFNPRLKKNSYEQRQASETYIPLK
jgi:Aspartyl protease